MSEEILRALMQLFALIVKQDEGVERKEREYVENFLVQQLNEDAVKEYLTLFDQHAGLLATDGEEEKENQRFFRAPPFHDRLPGIGNGFRITQ